MVVRSWHSISGSTERSAKMRKYKTSKANRATYRYYDIEGKLCCELVSGQNGITEILIQQLHAADDEEYDANRREAYHIPVHYMAFTSGDAEEAEDRNLYLADDAADPSVIFEKAFSRAEFKREFRERWNRLTREQQRLVLRKANGETNVAIAEEQGITEAAVRKQLKRIQKHFLDIH